MAKSGLHKKLDKVSYNHINPNAGIGEGGLPITTLRLSGWLIGGDVPEVSKKPSLQKSFNRIFDDVGETTKSVEPLVAARVDPKPEEDDINWSLS
jgi:hypothetical protein